MTDLDKNLIRSVSAFVVLTVLYLAFPNKGQSVFWAIYSFALKDLFIISLVIPFIGHSKKASSIAMAISFYLTIPTLIRLSCAIKANFNYDTYRKLISVSDYSYFLILVLFVLSILVYYDQRNGRKD